MSTLPRCNMSYRIVMVVAVAVLASTGCCGNTILRGNMNEAGNIVPEVGAIPVPPPGIHRSLSIFGSDGLAMKLPVDSHPWGMPLSPPGTQSKLPVIPGPGYAGFAINNHPSEIICPKEQCDDITLLKPGCKLEENNERYANGCLLHPCGKKICKDEPTGPGEDEVHCPLPKCPSTLLKPGCTLKESNEQDSKGCPLFPCGKKVCNDDPQAFCATPMCPPPPPEDLLKPGCKVEDNDEKDANGCLLHPCGKKICEDEPSGGSGPSEPVFKIDEPLQIDPCNNETENIDNIDVNTIATDPLASENLAIQDAHVSDNNHTEQKIVEENIERNHMAENQAQHDNMINQLNSIHAQLRIAMDDPTEHQDVETALNKTVNSMTGIEAINDADKVTDEKLIKLHVNVNIMKYKAGQEHKREEMATLIKKEKLYAMATEWRARCAKWTARLSKARMVLANAFKNAMKSSKLAQKGCIANQNDHITKAQLKWSSLAINEVKCTFKYLLAIKVNKLKICDASRKASLSARTLQKFPMPAFDGIKCLHSDKALALLSLNNKRASEKTKIARNDVKAIRAGYEAKGMGVEKLVKKEIDADDGIPKNGVETLEMTFKRIMGREMNLTWTKPQHYSNNRTLPNPIDTAKEECLGGNCNLSSVDENNDRQVKMLAKRKLIAAQPLPSAAK
eukprot:g8037.t1